MQKTQDVKKGRLYWGNMPLPSGGEIVGTVRRENGEEGALIKMSSNPVKYVQGNAGVIRNLPK